MKLTAAQVETIRQAACSLAPRDNATFVTETTSTLSALSGLSDKIVRRIVHNLRKKYSLPPENAGRSKLPSFSKE